MTNPAIRLKEFQEQFKKAAVKNAPDEPFVFEEIATLSMHFDMRSIQSVMRKNDPDSLVLSYTRAMMGFLFFKSRSGTYCNDRTRRRVASKILHQVSA